MKPEKRFPIKIARSFSLLIKLLRAEIPGLQAVYLFGSRATGYSRKESDVDLALMAEQPLERMKLYDTASQCADLLRQEVDLIDLRKANLVLIREILRDGQLLYEGDSNAVAWFETISLSRYCNLNEERKEIVRDIVKRGKVHGG